MTHLNPFCTYEYLNHRAEELEYVFEYIPLSDQDLLHYDDYHAILKEDEDGKTAYVEEIFFYDLNDEQINLTGDRFNFMSQWLYKNRGDDIQNYWSANR